MKHWMWMLAVSALVSSSAVQADKDLILGPGQELIFSCKASGINDENKKPAHIKLEIVRNKNTDLYQARVQMKPLTGSEGLASNSLEDDFFGGTASVPVVNPGIDTGWVTVLRDSNSGDGNIHFDTLDGSFKISIAPREAGVVGDRLFLGDLIGTWFRDKEDASRHGYSSRKLCN